MDFKVNSRFVQHNKGLEKALKNNKILQKLIKSDIEIT